MRYYAIADLHGRYDLLIKSIDAINKDSVDVEHKIITLGDYIDRGPESKQIVHFLSEHQGDRIICLQGNHEAMMVETVTTPLMPGWWVGNGGDATLKSYGWGGEPYSIYAYDVLPKAHIEWMQNLPLYFETEKQMFVHAGMPQWGMNVPPSDTTKGERLRIQMQWMLYSGTDAGGWKNKHVVHGHHQFADGPHTWHHKAGGRTDLDCYAWKTGRLVIGVFDDTQGPSLRYIEVLGEDYHRDAT